MSTEKKDIPEIDVHYPYHPPRRDGSRCYNHGPVFLLKEAEPMTREAVIKALEIMGCHVSPKMRNDEQNGWLPIKWDGVQYGRIAIKDGRFSYIKWYRGANRNDGKLVTTTDYMRIAWELASRLNTTLTIDHWSGFVSKAFRRREADIVQKMNERTEMPSKKRRSIRGKAVNTFIREIVEEFITSQQEKAPVETPAKTVEERLDSIERALANLLITMGPDTPAPEPVAAPDTDWPKMIGRLVQVWDNDINEGEELILPLREYYPDRKYPFIAGRWEWKNAKLHQGETRPNMIEWSGGSIPVGGGEWVLAELRNNSIMLREARLFRWSFHGNRDDIIRYTVIKP